MFKTGMAILFFVVSCLAHSEAPVINQYDATITIRKNAEIIVREVIDVTTDGVRIKRGIYRDFPTRYKTPEGYDFDIGFRLLDVRRDGKSEPYRVVNRSNGVRIYIGSSDTFITPGRYQYQIMYSVNRALGFFANHDELYWNVTGNQWAFPIQSATALVVLPEQVKIEKAMVYTGPPGARSHNAEISYPQNNEVLFTTTKALPAGHGLTVVAGWPKGIIIEPDWYKKINYFLEDNSQLAFMALCYVLLLVFYGVAWFYLGRDPDSKTVIPLFEPPQDFSPQSLRYIKKMGYDNKIFTAAIVNMAVKKYLTIEEKKDDEYVLRKTGADESLLTEPEKAISKELFKYSGKMVITQENHSRISEAIDQFKKALKTAYRDKYFVTNTPVVILGFIISIISFVPVFYHNISLLFPVGFIAFFALIFIKVIHDVFLYMKRSSFIIKGIASVVAAVFLIVMFRSFFSSEMMDGEVAICVAVAIFIATNAVFMYLIKRPTALGAEVIQQARGFEMFLKATEEDRLNFRNPPDRTPELFERYLPFALALGLEQVWSSQFSGILAQYKYQPSWYVGSHYHDFSPTSFSNTIGSSLNSAIASSSVAPGSSSGFSGGGSSGGGGGGGGGGGW
ncbi:DUF2207 domain-containing protein [Legionella spiritensis]|uniref:DUF2207 domain-containing protein n=1 Tax=Legionella spiritensis TaxID=452 RepID=UPI000F6E53E6|nr:DUF2207 domain-containing protein [Legionella spiritensis]VEG90616.1 Predicted membrane protein (DUF2207) [Legionella spiritensis]